jgi:cytochrome c oxidase cbb3-type subunit I/II
MRSGWLLLALLAAGCEAESWNPDRLLSGTGTTVSSETIARGREAYTTFCIGCHGSEGDGEGPAARFLDPKPRDLRRGRIKFASVAAGEPPRDEDLLRVITEGLHGTSMPAWDLVPVDERRAIVAYIRTFSEAWNAPPGAVVAIPPDPFRKRPEQGVEEGERVYHGLAACSSCHPAYVAHARIAEHMKAADITVGSFRASLYEPVTKESDWGQPIRPPDFLVDRVKAGSDRQSLVRTIATGVGGTAMPSWGTSLKPRQLWGLAYYIESLVAMRDTEKSRALQRELLAQPPFAVGVAQ